MKKTILPFLLLCVLAFSLQAGQIKKTYSMSNYTIDAKGTYQTIGFSNALLSGKLGEPMLPYYAVSLLLNPGEIAESIEFIGENEVIIPGKFNIFPQQGSQPISIGSSGVFQKNNLLYNTDASYPSIATGHLSTNFMNGYGIAMSVFTPVKYNPVTGAITYYQKVTIIVNTKKSDVAEEALKNLSSREETIYDVKQLVQNPENVSTYPLKESKDVNYELLIITTNAYQNSFQNLILLYQQRGIRTKVTTTETIYAMGTGNDNQSKIRNYIKQEYQSYSIQYVLLGGDIELVPYRGFYCQVQSSSVYTDSDIPADLYYSALDGTWNTDNDSKWGEIGEDDLLPELSVGRMPFSNATELSNLLNKTISYQNTPVLGELHRVLLAGELLDAATNTYGENYLRLLIGHHTDNGYTTTGIPYSATYNDTLYDHISTWSTTQLLTKINQGRPFIHHSGHANSDYVMRLYNSDITNANFYNVNGTTHNYELVYTHGCICGSFDANDCIGEKMTNLTNFAVSFIGNSRYGWFNEGFTEGPSAHLHREFVNALYTDSLCHVGEAHKWSKTRTAPWVNAPGQWEEGALRWCFYDNNVLGDPTLAIWTNEPITIAVNYPASVAVNITSFNVNVTRSGIPAKNFRCALIKSNVLYGLGVTDASGNAQVNILQTLPTGTAQLLVSGYNCLPISYNIDYTPVGISEITNTANVLMEIYPNPASQAATINYYLTSASDVKISIYNSLGQMIDQVVEISNQLPGNYSIAYQVSDLSQGLYYCKIETNGRSLIKKFAVTK